MAEAPFMTTKAPTPTAPTLPNSLAQGINPSFATDPTYLQQMAALNHQLETTLSGDKETLTRDANAYNRQLEVLGGRGGREETGFNNLAYRNEREFGSGTSGFAQTRRQNLASQFTTNRAQKAEVLGENLKRVGVGAQEAGEKGAITAGGYSLAAKGRAEAKALKTPGIAPQASIAGAGGVAAGTAGQGGVQGYPKATAYVNALFPNPGEQVAFSKMTPEQKRNWEATHRAKGGPVQAGKPYVVGEQGPELIVPKTNGKVIPNRTAKNAQNIRRRAIERIGRWHG